MIHTRMMEHLAAPSSALLWQITGNDSNTSLKAIQKG